MVRSLYFSTVKKIYDYILTKDYNFNDFAASHKFSTMTISGTLTTSPRCLPNQGKLLQKESMVNQSHDSGVDSMNTNSSGN